MAKPKTTPTTREGILKALADNSRDRQRVAREDSLLLEQRDELFLAARAAEPPIVVREVAQLSGLTEVAVNKRLKQLRDAGR